MSFYFVLVFPKTCKLTKTITFYTIVLFKIKYSLVFRFDDCVTGGESSLVDAFEAAEILKEESPKDFQALVEIPVLFTTIDYERSAPLYPIYFQHQKPHIAVDYFGNVGGLCCFCINCFFLTKFL